MITGKAFIDNELPKEWLALVKLKNQYW